MFYSQFLLSKNGPLGVIWIAAHLERKLRKKQITETDIGDSVDSILYSEVPIALRISSHLLLGVVRIYSRKVAYLFHDCSEALVKIRQAFQTSAINLPPKALVAPYHTITLPESFDFDELGVYVNPEDAARAGTWAEFEHHVTDRDLITLHEPMEVRGLSQSLFTLDGGFSEDPNPYTISSLSTEEEVTDLPKAVPIDVPSEEVQQKAVEEDVLPPLPMEEYTDLEDLDYGMEKNFDLKKRAEDEALEEQHPAKVLGVEVSWTSTKVTGQEVLVEFEQTSMHKEDLAPMDIDIDHGPLPDKKIGAEGERQDVGEIPIVMDIDIDHGPLPDKKIGAEGERQDVEEIPIVRETSPPRTSVRKSQMAAPEDDGLGTILGVSTPKLAAEYTPVPPQQRKRKRKLVFDNVAVISSYTMKKQLGTSSDICRLRKKAPSTEYQIWMSQRDNNVDNKFSGASLPGLCPELKALSNFILNTKPQQLDKELKSRQDAAAADSGSVQEEISKDKKEEGHVESDVEELGHEDGDRIIEIEVLSTVKQRVVTDVPSTPPRSPQPEEAGAEKIESEVVSTVRRRLEFEAPSTPQRSPHPLMETEIDAQQVEPSPPRLHGEDFTISIAEEMANHVAPNGPVEEIHDEAILEPPEVGPSKVIAEEISRQQREVSPPVSQASEDLSDQLQSQDLEFLADSREPDAGNGTLNGSVDMSGSVDTESEHFGKFMQDKSGWAFRTRAVAEYLKEKFEDARTQGTNEQPVLSLSNLLQGRRRKEAARMFFETLVLRSNDYIQVQQQNPFSDIYMQPTERLMTACL